MSHPAYKPPPALYTKAKVAKGGAYLRDTTVHVQLAQRGWGIEGAPGEDKSATTCIKSIHVADFNLAVSTPTANKPPNVVPIKFFRLYGITENTSPPSPLFNSCIENLFFLCKCPVASVFTCF